MNFETLLAEKYNFVLKPQQREAVLNNDGPIILHGVPGSGKSTVVALRCANMAMCCGIPAESILTLTFNAFTQKDLELRFERIFGKVSQVNIRFTTMNNFCSQLLREYYSLTNGSPPKLIESCKRTLLRSLYAELNHGEFISDNHMDELIKTMETAKSRMMAFEQVEPNSGTARGFDKIHTAFEKYLNEYHCMDNDDMQSRALAILNGNPAFLEKLREKFSYINVDEAQEMTRIQYAIIKLLAAGRNNLFITGDGDQCLYSGRTGNSECMHDLISDYPQARQLHMERNYRSTHAIVNAANHLTKIEKACHEHTMDTGNEIGMPVEETVLPDNNLLGSHLVSRLKNETNPVNSAILYRGNTSAIAILDALEREGIPFCLRDEAKNFFDHWVVRDILAFMALGHNPADISALRQVFRKLNASISQDVLNQVATDMDQGLCRDALELLLSNAKVSGNAAMRVKKLKENISLLPDMQPGSAVQYVLAKLGYREYLNRYGGEALYMEGLLQIAESLKTIASRTSSYQEFLARIEKLALISKQARENTGDGVVTLSTIHAAKGLEFRNVYVVDLFEGRFQALDVISESCSEEYEQEERRIFYVAITRACKYVELVYTTRNDGERVKPIRFVRELLPFAPVRKARTQSAVRNKKEKAAKGTCAADIKPSSMKPAPKIPPVTAHIALEPGMLITHKAFGQGVISAFDFKHDVISIRFQKYGMKKLSASLCETSGLLRKPDEEKDSLG